MKTTKFKPSEVGPIPEEWEVKRLGDVTSINPSPDKPRLEKFVYVDLESVKNGSLLTRNVVEASCAPSRAQRQFRENDILYQTVRPYQCNNLYVNFEASEYIASTGYAVLRSVEIDSKYLYTCLHTHKFVESVLDNCTGTSYPAINPNKLASLEIPVPPRPEQEKIAEALSDVDALLAAMTTLIEKKRAIKQGAMQQLLTGKKRLAGFSGKWVEKRLGDCALIKARIGWQGLTTAEYLKNGPYYLITGSDFKDGRINWSQCYFVDKARYDQDKYIQIKKDDVLVSKDGTIGKVAFLDDVPGEGTLNSGVFVIRSTDKMIDQPYLAWVFLSRWFDDFIDRLVAGSTIVHLYQKDIVGFEFPVPPTLAEQKAIAGVLSDMDAEIAALESKRAKYESIKQGMMQELLTGRVRLG